ncbi:MAG TPA: hypothetical protein VFM10_12630 [Terriglobales bacterium]|nr:hypothetical protein [Terriglobales bacterium]
MTLARVSVGLLIFVVCSVLAQAANLSVPKQVVAGDDLTIRTSGSGDATLIIVGPGHASREKVRLGDTVTLKASDISNAGRYIAVLKSSEGNSSTDFFVTAGAPASISFLAQPSRVPAARPQAIGGTAFVLDRDDNLVTKPMQVKFELAVPGTAAATSTSTTKDGIAWVRMNSGKREGPAQFVASIGDISTRRVVQQVAADPCNLRMRAQRDKNAILVETDPVRDCSGNAVPDGTIVTFTQVDDQGKTTVDARIKRGVAKAELPAASKATISVASGVVVGNEIRWGGGL